MDTRERDLTPEQKRLTERLLAFLRPDAPDWLPPGEPVMPDATSPRGLMRRLEEERITAVWAHDLLAKERQESANLRACIVGLQVALRNANERRWRERVGLVAVGVIVALGWVWVAGGGSL